MLHFTANILDIFTFYFRANVVRITSCISLSFLSKRKTEAHTIWKEGKNERHYSRSASWQFPYRPFPFVFRIPNLSTLHYHHHNQHVLPPLRTSASPKCCPSFLSFASSVSSRCERSICFFTSAERSSVPPLFLSFMSCFPFCHFMSICCPHSYAMCPDYCHSLILFHLFCSCCCCLVSHLTYNFISQSLIITYFILLASLSKPSTHILTAFPLLTSLHTSLFIQSRFLFAVQVHFHLRAALSYLHSWFFSPFLLNLIQF